MTHVLGIDIGGSGIKGAPVDVSEGRMVAERHRIETPQPAVPEDVATTVRKVVEAFPGVGGPIGCTFPAIVRAGIVGSAANVDPSWVGVDANRLLSERTDREVVVLNDADAAGLAEAHFGAARDCDGLVLLLTFGTGIGSAMIIDGALVPNTELGHLEMDGMPAEDLASSRARTERELSYEQWTELVNRYFSHLERLFSPTRIVLGGGISKRFDEYGHLLEADAEIVPAVLRNNAGIVGAAMWAVRQPGSTANAS